MPYAVTRLRHGEAKTKILRYRFPTRGEAEKMRLFFDQQVKDSMFRVIWIQPEEVPVNAATRRKA